MTRDRGQVTVITGHGKGKTTAALGILVRAWSEGRRVAMYQFLKQTQARFGEHRSAERLGIPIRALGDGFTWRSRDLEHTAALAARQWSIVDAAMRAADLDLIVLDEFTYVLTRQWVGTDVVLRAIRARPAGLDLVITGRDAPSGLLAVADVGIDMAVVKHPYRDQGLKAQVGIEF